MAIERMEMMNVVGHCEDMNKVLRDLVVLGCLQPIREVQQSHIASTLDIMSFDVSEGAKWVQFPSSKWEFREAQMHLELLMTRMGIKGEVDAGEFGEDYDFKDIEANINVMFDRFAGLLKQIEGFEKERKKLDRFRVISILKDVNLDLNELETLSHYSYRIGTISKEHRQKLAINYENISAAVMHLGDMNNQEIYMVIFPKDLETENLRILRSIDFEEYEILKEYLDVPVKMMNRVETRIAEIDMELESLNQEIDRFRSNFEPVIKDCYNKLRMEEILVDIRSQVTVTRNFFFVSAWVAQREVNRAQKALAIYSDRLIISVKKEKEVDEGHVRPTKLRNNWLVRPFELLVKTYGTPSYQEMDPTFFVGITYMLLFGVMFGDLGQGFVLFLAGLFVAKKINPMGGGILSRIGICSMVTGTFFDSFFGMEHVISSVTAAIFGKSASEAFHFYTMENINTVMLLSVLGGIILLFISFGISIFNKLKAGDFENGVLGDKGIAGFVLYLILLQMVYGMVAGGPIIPTALAVVLVIILTLITALRHPISNMIRSHTPIFHDSVGSFTVEAFFETFEVYLAYFSNTLSFVRVGAFALNHVGMFSVFIILADMIGGMGGKISMYLLGNIVILGLEGMIVMIQGMRLVYYEIFSKFFNGDGIDFKAITLEA